MYIYVVLRLKFRVSRPLRARYSSGRAFQGMPAMAPKAASYGPTFKRNTLLDVSALCVSAGVSGWRGICEARVAELLKAFMGGLFGLSVLCSVQILEKEHDGMKVIDDGVSTVMALQKCQALQESDPEATPDKEPWPANLLEIFQNGLPVRVVGYTDDDDVDVRFAWNVAKHDEDSNSVRWSTVADQIGVPLRLFRRHGDWAVVSQKLKDLYGPGKKAACGRWARAAKGMHPEIAEELAKYPSIPGAAVYDNEYLVLNSTAGRHRLTAKGGESVLRAWKKARDSDDKVTATVFANTMCRSMRILEVWHDLMVKRFGSVAVNSPALIRLMEHLGTFAGLQKVMACAASGLNLHGKSPEQQGIPECYILEQELAKCVAGGLPPPMTIPSEVELRQRKEDARQSAEEEKKRKAEEEAETRAQEEVRSAADLDAEADMFVLGSAAAPAESSTTVTREREIKNVFDARMSKVHFCDTPEGLLTEAHEALSTQPRIIVVVEAPTTDVVAFGQLLDFAHEVWQTYQRGHGAGGEGQKQFRVIVLLGSRWDLLAKASAKITVTWPGWSRLRIQLQGHDWQTSRHRPGDALLLCPPGEASKREPVTLGVALPNSKSIDRQGLHLRCSDENCPWRRAVILDPQAAKSGDPTLSDIDSEDRQDVLAALLDEQENAEAPESQAGKEPSGESTGGSQTRKGMVLWPYAQTLEYHKQVLEVVGSAGKAQVAIIVSTTAHPNHWLACLGHQLETYVLTRRWSGHSEKHGLTLGKAAILEETISQTRGKDQEKSSVLQQFLEVDVVQSPQIIEAYDCHQGSAWNDGLNRGLQAAALEKHAAAMQKTEAEQQNLRIGQQDNDGERFLETLVPLRDGAKVVVASCLFFDDWNKLMAFLDMPGNGQWRGKVARMQGVKHGGTERTIWAPLVGVARFCSHFQGRRGRPNCNLVFDPALGFNSGSLTLQVATRNGSGVAANSPLLLNYGVDFDFHLASLQGKDDNTFKGALDVIFASQKAFLHSEHEEHEEQQKKEEAEQAKQAAIEAAAKLEKEKEEQEQAAKRREMEENAKKALQDTAEKKKRAADAVTGDHASKKSRLEGTVVHSSESTGLELILCEPGGVSAKLALRNTRTTNAKLRQDTVLAMWCSTDEKLLKDVNGFEFAWTLKTQIYDKALGKKMALDKYIKEIHPETTVIYKHKPFPAGTLPKVLVKESASAKYVFDSKALNRIFVLQAVEKAALLQQCTLHWMAKYDEKSHTIRPHGVVLLLGRGVVVNGETDLQLE